MDAAGPLGRELVTLKIGRLVDLMVRSAQLSFTRVSGLSNFKWRVVAWVNELEPLSINELATLLQRHVAQVSRTVKELVAAGLLHRASRGGGPGVLITSTPAGKTVYGPIRKLSRSRDARIIQGLNEEEVRVFKHCVEVMTRNAHALLAHDVKLARRDGVVALDDDSKVMRKTKTRRKAKR